LRFVCDHDVDVAVAATLRRLGHDAWTAANAGLSAASDDELTVYADNQGAALVTHDVEFSKRRQRNVIGKHVWLRCSEMDAAQLVEDRIDELAAALNIHKDVWIRLSSDGLALSFAWK
jgi:predicted nuclease of predicted toxin-antitoxin system